MYRPPTMKHCLKGPLTGQHLGCSVLKGNAYAPAWREVCRHHPWLVLTQRIADLGMQSIERHVGIALAGQHQER
jgi:hypothetical protein